MEKEEASQGSKGVRKGVLSVHEQKLFCFQKCWVLAALSLASQETHVRNCPFLVNINEVPFLQGGGKPSFKRQKLFSFGKI